MRMISNDERREVAARLRKLAPGSDWPNKTAEACGLNPREMSNCFHEFTGELCERLADLIDPQERTCINESASGKYFACSECGAELMQITPGWVALVRGRVNYCPNCGARFTGGAEVVE